MKFIKHIAICAVAALVLLGAVLAIWLVYLGYFSSDPVKIIPAEGRNQSEYAVVFLSGDMGFNAGMGPKIVQKFTADGVPVVAFNSLTFFRTKRTRVEVADMLRDLIITAHKRFGRKNLVLVGQSFGADALQLGLADLKLSERRDVKLVALTVPTNTIYLQASPNELFNLTPPDISALPTASKLDWVPVVCIYGREETGSLCPKLKLKNADLVPLPGGHFLDKNAELVYETLEGAISRAGN